jgi:kumamolisin
VTGTGQTVGILELGGGYLSADLKSYFASEKLAEPTVTPVSVDKATNKSSDQFAPGARHLNFFWRR